VQLKEAIEEDKILDGFMLNRYLFNKKMKQR